MSSRDNRPAGAIRLGNLLGSSAQRNGSVGRSDRIDFYTFTSDQAFDLSASLRLRSRASNVRIDLLSSAGSVLSSRSGRNPRLTGEFDAGTYFLRVRQVRGDTNYRLTASASQAEPGAIAGRERNLGTLRDSVSVSESVGSTDSRDLYKFNLDRISDFSATLGGLSQSARLALFLDNGNGIIDSSDILVAANTNGSVSQNSNIATVLPAGTYFVEVQDNSFTNSSTRYDLTLTTVSRSGNVSPDPTSTAPFSTNGSGTFSDLVGNLDELDYYKFTLNQISDFSAAITNLSQNVRVSLYLDSNNNGIKDSSDRSSVTPALGSSTQAGNVSTTLPAGTYFVEIDYDGFASSNTRYDLTLTTTPRPGNVSPDPTATAPFLVQGSGIFSDLVGVLDPQDYYRFTLNRRLFFDATLSGFSQNVTMKLYLDSSGNGVFDNNDSQITSASGGTFTNTSISRDLSAGTYFIQLEYDDLDANNTRYDLSLSILELG